MYSVNTNTEYAVVAEWQTRLFKGQVRNRVGSSPTDCTKKWQVSKETCRFFYFLTVL